MAEMNIDLPLGKTPRVRTDVDGIEVFFTMTGDPDDLWCELFVQAGVVQADPDVADAIVHYFADSSGIASVTVKPALPDGVVQRVFEWLREVAAVTNVRWDTLEREAERVQRLAARWADNQVV